jgi:hypothetical protein
MNTKDKRALWGFVGCLSLGLSFLAACSAATRGVDGGQGGASSGSGNGGVMVSSSGMGGDPIFATSSNTGSSSSGIQPDASCASVSSEAQAQLQPADIIIAVDTSGSMSEEIAQVQQNLNKFAQIITASGVDVHVVLIADASMCIPMPLGNGSCNGADENLPNYRHVVQTVNSTDGLQVILNTHPDWKDVLRPNATKTIAIVSDDDSDLAATAFINQLVALDPTFTGFKFDAIVSFDMCSPFCVINCATCTSSCCNKAQFCSPISAAEGKVYKQLVMQTGGVIGNLCIQNFDPVFQDMAKAVVTDAKISCEYAIPTPPDGQTIDPTLINVVHTSGSGTKNTIYNVPNGEMGCGTTGGWYFDNAAAPTKIIVCSNTCAALQSTSGGKVEVLFGCATEVKVPD